LIFLILDDSCLSEGLTGVGAWASLLWWPDGHEAGNTALSSSGKSAVLPVPGRGWQPATASAAAMAACYPPE
jgi:hypothetical protein